MSDKKTTLDDGRVVYAKYVQNCDNCLSEIYVLADEYLKIKEVRRDEDGHRETWEAIYCSECKTAVWATESAHSSQRKSMGTGY